LHYRLVSNIQKKKANMTSIPLVEVNIESYDKDWSHDLERKL